MLGDAQWAWLEERLREPAELRLVVSSIQVVAEDHGFEGWSRLPLERERLLALVDETGAEGVLFLSGDRHIAELSILDPERSAESSAVDVGYPIVDLTSSSLNVPHPWHNEINRHRLGSVYHAANFGTIEIEWSETTRVALSIRNDRGEVVLHHRVDLGDLRR
jgi:alkaline phosphatase D